jgi:hypothetical protein
MDVEWSSRPRNCDLPFYERVVRPAITKRSQEYLERSGPLLVVQV